MITAKRSLIEGSSSNENAVSDREVVGWLEGLTIFRFFFGGQGVLVYFVPLVFSVFLVQSLEPHSIVFFVLILPAL